MPRLVIVSQQGQAQLYQMLASEVVFGRDTKNANLVLPLASVSRQHGRFQWDADAAGGEGRLRVTDLGSKNGLQVQLGGQESRHLGKGESVELRPGDSLSISGVVSLHYVADNAKHFGERKQFLQFMPSYDPGLLTSANLTRSLGVHMRNGVLDFDKLDEP